MSVVPKYKVHEILMKDADPNKTDIISDIKYHFTSNWEPVSTKIFDDDRNYSLTPSRVIQSNTGGKKRSKKSRKSGKKSKRRSRKARRSRRRRSRK